MTVASTTSKSGPYNGNGVTVNFAVNFKYTSTSDVDVIVTSAAGVETTKTITTHYTITAPGDSGTVTFLTAPASGETVTIVRTMEMTQSTDYTSGGGFSSATVEATDDRQLMQIQEIAERVSRAPKLRQTTSSTTPTFPEPLANNLIGWNSGATDLENKVATDINLAIVTPFIETLLDDATAAAARTTLGALGGAVGIVDGTVPRADGTGGVTLQGSSVIIDDSNNVSGIGNLTISGSISGAVNLTQTGYHDITEIAEPASPSANVARVRAIDEGGVTTVGHKDSAGNIVPWSHYLQAGTGATLRTVRAKLRDSISVKDFGAVGDGTTDDTAAIQAAIDYAESITLVTVPGAAVFFPSGRYLVTAPLTVQESGVYLLGEGRDSTVLVRDHDAGATIKFSRNTSTAIQGVGIKNMWLIDTDDSMTVGNSPFHLVFDNVDRLQMSDILFSQGAGGFVLSRVVGAEISNISMSLPTGTTTSRRGILVTSTAIGGVSVAWGSGIFMNNIEILAGTGVVSTTTLDWGLDILTVDGIWINNFHVYNTTLANIRIRREGADACGNIYMTNIMSDHSAGHGILIDGAAVPQRVQIQGTCSGLGSTAATSRGLQIVGPILDAVFELSVDGYDSDGLYLDNASASDVVFRCGSVRGNDADSGGTAGGGLYIKQATRVSVIGGTFGGAGIEDWGIRIGNLAANVSVVGATCRDNAGPGIQIDSGADEITIVGNTLTGNGGGAIADNSIATRLIANNLGHETYGTVTQATSKTTGVTLNTTTGQITMNNASLGATPVNFIVTNSQFLAGDMVVVNHEAGGVTFGGYTINARGIADGSFAIDVRNNTGGALIEAIVIGFRIIRKVFA